MTENYFSICFSKLAETLPNSYYKDEFYRPAFEI